MNRVNKGLNEIYSDNKKRPGLNLAFFKNRWNGANYLVQLPKFSVVRAWPSSKPAL